MSRWDPILGLLHHVDIGCIANVSEILTVFRNRVHIKLRCRENRQMQTSCCNTCRFIYRYGIEMGDC